MTIISSICICLLDSSLDDIKYVLNPTFDKTQIAQLDKSDKQSRAIDGSMYSPGIVGMNNIKANDYCNVILQVIYCDLSSVNNNTLYILQFL